ncbi:MAG: septum formation protein Maf [Chloroflexi bacterium]|nr:septum formation protein Maf [Chloroflexota bacterium]
MLNRLVLASASPRRQLLVGLLSHPYRVAPQDVDEAAFVLEDPVLTALNIARAKARSARPALDESEIALTADTIVVSDGQALGKPRSPEEARNMLRALRARPHVVATGVSLTARNGEEWNAIVTTRVFMRHVADVAIDAYVARGEPFDKAGGYAIQDEAFNPVERVEGCYLNVVGLPLCAVSRGLETLGAGPAGSEERLLPPCHFCRSAPFEIPG